LCPKRKVASAQRLAKNLLSIQPTFCAGEICPKLICCLPNAFRQQKLFILFAQKSRENTVVKSTPRECDFNLQSKIVIFLSILTTFINLSFISN